MRGLLAGILLLTGVAGSTQLLHFPAATPYAAAAAYSRYQADAFSFQYNPALLLHHTRVHLGLMGYQPFLLPGHAGGAAGVAVPMGKSRLGAQVQHRSNSSMHQSGSQASFAQTLGNKAAIGTAFQYQSVAVAGYGTIGMLGAALGAAVQLSPQVTGGGSIFLPAATLAKNSPERLGAFYQVGVGYDLSEEVFLSARLEKEETRPVQLAMAAGFLFSGRVGCRLGVHTGAGQYFMGAGYRIGAVQVHLFSSWHQRLGFSPGVQVLMGQNVKND